MQFSFPLLFFKVHWEVLLSILGTFGTIFWADPEILGIKTPLSLSLSVSILCFDLALSLDIYKFGLFVMLLEDFLFLGGIWTPKRMLLGTIRGLRI